MTTVPESTPAPAIARVEDRRFVTGRGRYVADVVLAREVFAVFVRSPHPHADIVAIDAAPALAVPGVLGVYTGACLARDGVGPLPAVVQVKNRDGTPQAMPPRPALPVDRVRHVGDPVAVVVACSEAIARDAAELVEVSYAPLAAVTDLAAATLDDAPRIWEQARNNI